MWDRLETYDGDMVKQYKPAVYKELMSTQEAGILTEYMTKTVEEGTASALSGLGYTAAGKTGSAEYEIGGNLKETHSWFVGFSNVENPDIAIAVIAENGDRAVPQLYPLPDRFLTHTMNTLSSTALRLTL